MPSKPFVLIVEDERDLADSLKQLIGSQGLPCVVFSSAEEFLRDELVDRCGCVVLGVNLPGISGLDCQERMRIRGIQAPVIIIAGAAADSETTRALDNGALCVIHKPVNLSALLAAVLQAISGDSQRRQAENIRDWVRNSLTDRERELLELLLHDRSPQQIARLLKIRPQEVEQHREKILSKVGARSVEGLASYYLRAHSVDSPAADLPDAQLSESRAT